MISVILPTYNEKDNIIHLIDSIIKVFNEISNTTYEIIIVDDSSPDGTSEEVNKYGNRDGIIKLITRSKERGLASAIKVGINNSKGDYIIIMDTDLSHPPRFIKKLVDVIKESDADAVIASRYIKGGKMYSKKYKYILSKLMNLIIGIILNLKIKDLTGGFFIIKKSLLENISLEKVFIGYGDYFFRLFFKLRKVNYSFREIPFEYAKRITGESKTQTFQMGLDYLKTMISLRLGK